MNALLMRLTAIGAANWFEEAQELFNGEGSFGNGAAIRVAPVGAYFSYDLNVVAEHAALSAIATHCHPEGLAGAVAVALAAALASRERDAGAPVDAKAFLDRVRRNTPEGIVRDGIGRAIELPDTTTPLDAALTIGNGSHGTAQDTVPFVLWSAARSLDNYEHALWETVSGGGGIDTNCAIVGGIVATRTGAQRYPGGMAATPRAAGASTASRNQIDLGHPDGFRLKRYAEELAHAGLDGIAQCGDIGCGSSALVCERQCVAAGDRGRAQTIAFDEASPFQ